MTSVATETPLPQESPAPIPSSSSACSATAQSIDADCIAANANKFHVQLRHTQAYRQQNPDSSDISSGPAKSAHAATTAEAADDPQHEDDESGDVETACIRFWPSGTNDLATRGLSGNRRNSRSAESIPLMLSGSLDATDARYRRKNSVPDDFNGELLKTLLSIGKDKYSSVESPDSRDDAADTMMPPLQSQPSNVPAACADQGSLIAPKKLHNPCLESADHKNLHRELMFNQKIGKSVLNQKTELQQALQKKKERQQLSAQLHEQQQRHEMGSELGRAIMQRAQRLEQQQHGVGNESENEHQLNAEYMKIRAKLRATDAK